MGHLFWWPPFFEVTFCFWKKLFGGHNCCWSSFERINIIRSSTIVDVNIFWNNKVFGGNNFCGSKFFIL